MWLHCSTNEMIANVVTFDIKEDDFTCVLYANSAICAEIKLTQHFTEILKLSGLRANLVYTAIGFTHCEGTYRL